MPTLNLFSFLSGEINGKKCEVGSLSVPATVSVTLSFEKMLSIGPTTTVSMFDVTKDLASFAALYLVSDFDVMVEFTTDLAGAVGIQYATMKLPGTGIIGKFGWPLILPSNVSYGNYTTNFGGGTLETIDRVRVRNLDVTNTAQCLLMAFK